MFARKIKWKICGNSKFVMCDKMNVVLVSLKMMIISIIQKAAFKYN